MGVTQYENQFLELWYNQVSDATKKPTNFQSIDLWQLQKKSIESLMQLIEPEISEKTELEYRDESNIIATFEIFGPSTFCCMEENRHLFNLNVCSKLKFFDWDLDGKNHASTNVETWYWKLRWLKTQPSVRFGHQNFDTRIQLKTSQSNPSLQL